MIRKVWIIIILLVILGPGCKKSDIIGFDPAPVLMSPENGSTISENPPTFTWQGVKNNRYYEILLTSELEENSSESNIQFHNRIFTRTDTTISYTCEIMLPSGAYTWKVRWVKAVDT